MHWQQLIPLLQSRAGVLRAKGVAHLFLFGSVARNEAGLESDVDLFFDPAKPDISLIDVIGIQHYLDDQLGLKTDVMTRNALHPYLRDRIEASAVEIF
jgi:uncharacterized protein